MALTCAGGLHAPSRRVMLAIMAVSLASVCAGFVAPSTSPPGGLDPSNTPQFIVFTHDDAILPRTHELVTGITTGRSFNGCPATATMFVTTCCGNDCGLTMDLYNSGFEIADHTVNHISMKSAGQSVLDEQIDGARSELAQCGVPESDVVGFRAPFLESDQAVRQKLLDSGFLYDSSLIEDGTGGSLTGDMSSRVWPFSMDQGVPMNCDWYSGSQLCDTSEQLPGMFEVPVWQLIAEGSVWSMDYGVGPEANAYKVLKTTFDAAYNGNRAPLPVFVHTPWLEAHAKDVKKFLDYAASQPDTYMVTVRQLLAWVQNPVPADQLTPEILGCGRPGGAGGDAASTASDSAPSSPPPEGDQTGADGSADGKDGNKDEGSVGPSGDGRPSVDTYVSDPGTTTTSSDEQQGAGAATGGQSTLAAALAAAGFKVRRMLR